MARQEHSPQMGRPLQHPLLPGPFPSTDRTGAGDAFTATLMAAIAKGHTLETALAWAPINAMSVVQHVGSQAGLLTEKS